MEVLDRKLEGLFAQHKTYSKICHFGTILASTVMGTLLVVATYLWVAKLGSRSIVASAEARVVLFLGLVG